MTVILSSRRTAPTQRLSIIWYFIMPKLFFVCVCVSQLFLVNPDQLAWQERVTDTVDLKAISRLAACLLSSHLPCVFPHLLLTDSFPSSASLPLWPQLHSSDDSFTTVWHGLYGFFFCPPSPAGFMTHIVHPFACQLSRLDFELLRYMAFWVGLNSLNEIL